ncbi:S53 family peptidase [Derxia gummosa]|uniref:S53 family peptidase n=1 Tax=Derxia gummosa DSM 723 TaxID=1121388 RepID=A0A8B6XAC2_9BURK|nr:S53 family peptidase [Derxia gummosa]
MNRLPRSGSAVLLPAAVALALAACGGAGGDGNPVSAGAASVIATPVFDMLPVTVEPPDSDADGSAASATRSGRATALPAGAAGIDTRNLTLDAARARLAALPGRAAVAAVATTAVTYTPAQVRAAYGLPMVPAATDLAALDVAGRAALGAGQTLYLVAAYHHPNVVADLAAFSTRFGLPDCATVSVAASATPALPAIGNADGCSFIRVTATAAGGMSATVPAYNASWAQEIALDVQWAHALAPLARLVLVEAPSAAVTALNGAVLLANRFGAGVVSMSFGSIEGSWATGYDGTVFNGAGMSYVAAAGDNGSQANWPATSPSVLAVGGTTLAWSGSGPRTEKAWSKSGGAASNVFARPAYQKLAGLPAIPAGPRRLDADVALVADPYSGVYVGYTPNGGTRSWLSMGGTSAGTPAVAGMLASINGLRALDGKATLGKPQAALYGIAAVAGNYASAFLDVKTGANGSCAPCKAGSGFDYPTGLGTPNFGALASLLRAAN